MPDSDTSPENSIVEDDSAHAESSPNAHSSTNRGNIDLVLQHRSLGALGRIAYARQQRPPYR